MTEPELKAVLRRPDEGEQISIAGVDHFFTLTAAQTGGRFAMEEFTLAPGVLGARPHVHHGHDEYFYVLEGELTLHNGDDEVTVGPGHTLAAARGAPHGYRNAGTAPVRGLCLYTPAGYENYFREVHAAISGGVEASEAMLAEFRSRYRTTAWPPTR
jgi:quercetin dioxygenase-like cupin family protein